MRVLIAGVDLYSAIGGGQSFFCDLIASRHEDEFAYFASRPLDDGVLPPNARAVPLRDLYRAHQQDLAIPAGEFQLRGADLGHREENVSFLFDMAASVAGEHFDVLEIPDYLPFSALLAPAMRASGAQIDRVVLSMHGTLSMALEDNWAPRSTFDLTSLQRYEEFLFRSADLRYGIGRAYVDQWSAEHGHAAYLLDVGSIVQFERFAVLRRRSRGQVDTVTPQVVFIGRHEKWKGPDLYIDFVSSLPTRRDAFLIGPNVALGNQNSTDILSDMARRRQIKLQTKTLPRETLAQEMASNPWYLLLPSRMDTFNLSALEGLLAGCPAALSERAGVTSYLAEAFPGLPHLVVDPGNLAASRDAIIDQLADYTQIRNRLAAYLDANSPRKVGLSAAEIMGKPSDGDEDLNRELARLVRDLHAFIDQRVRHHPRERFYSELDSNLVKQAEKTSTRGHRSDALISHLLSMYRQADTFLEQRDRASALARARGPLSEGELFELTSSLGPMVFLGNRVPLYRVLAARERERGNELLYATYGVRILRLSGRSDPVLLDEVTSILRRQNFKAEADATAMLYGAAPADDEIEAYLHAARKAQSSTPTGDIERVIDRRSLETPRISVIVSLYRAADKLPLFVSGLDRFTETARRALEVVFVDSHSPDSTMDVYEREMTRLDRAGRPLSSVLVRTSVRETIQRAWNRGIAEARAPYIAFLGADEMNRPDAFELLASYLDKHPRVNWVQGSAVVTNVDASGSFVSDVMLYDRRFDNQIMQSLDTCYVSYVGALYRKSLHDKAGYYDDRFRGAGDTEFKNRAFPWMQAATLPECLGTFLNYPEERTTASPMAELEDIRAWYLFRSVGGLRYLFQNERPEAAADLFRRCLGYRKSYFDGTCTDLDFAAMSAAYLRETSPAILGALEKDVAAVLRARQAYIDLDTMADGAGSTRTMVDLLGVQEQIKESAATITEAQVDLDSRGWRGPLSYQNDNRSHQHMGIWPSVLSVVAPAVAEDGAERTWQTLFVQPGAVNILALTAGGGTPAVHVDGAPLPPLSAIAQTNGVIVHTARGRTRAGNRDPASLLLGTATATPTAWIVTQEVPTDLQDRQPLSPSWTEQQGGYVLGAPELRAGRTVTVTIPIVKSENGITWFETELERVSADDLWPQVEMRAGQALLETVIRQAGSTIVILTFLPTRPDLTARGEIEVTIEALEKGDDEPQRRFRLRELRTGWSSLGRIQLATALAVAGAGLSLEMPGKPDVRRPWLTISPSLSFALEGTRTFERPGDMMGRGSWFPPFDLASATLNDQLVVTLPALTDPATGDRAIGLRNAYRAESIDGRLNHRWSGPGRCLTIHVPVASWRPGQLALAIAMYGEDRQPDDFTVAVNGKDVTPIWSRDPEGRLVCNAPIPAGFSEERCATHIAVTCRRLFQSRGDNRILGFAVTSLELRFPLAPATGLAVVDHQPIAEGVPQRSTVGTLVGRFFRLGR